MSKKDTRGISDSWSTPSKLFDELSEKYGPFDIDLAATKENSKCGDSFYIDYLEDQFNGEPWPPEPTKELKTTLEDIIKLTGSKTCWINLPYSNPLPFIQKAWEDSKHCKIVLLVKVDPDKDGYLRVVLSKNNQDKSYIVSRLVAQAFLITWDVKLHVNHMDGNKLNNHYTNLEMVTPAQNNLHAYRIGLNSNKGEKSGTHKLKDQDIYVIREMVRQGYIDKEIASCFNVGAANIGYIRRRKTWTHI